ncbi:MAG: TIGR03435 family protein [Edaphobacter sp.]
MSKSPLGRTLSIIAAALLTITGSHLLGQMNPTQSSPSAESKDTNPAPLTFDIVSIKENKSGDRSGVVGNKTDGVYMVNMPLTTFLYQGFLPGTVYGVPKWVESDHYDLEAKVAESDLAAYRKASPAEHNRMLQAVFVERMKLKTHQETRELPIFTLVLAKNGSKLKRAEEETHERNPPLNSLNQGEGLYWGLNHPAGEKQLIGQGASMERLTQYLSYMAGIDRLVVDKTSLAGDYDFTLNWSSPTDSDGTGASIFTAIQEQLGLKLESTKGPVEVLVIDHIERPSEN